MISSCGSFSNQNPSPLSDQERIINIMGAMFIADKSGMKNPSTLKKKKKQHFFIQ